MKIILSRHGDTFGPNDKVVWAGATNDLPLVEKGLAQAEKLASVLLSKKIFPAAIYCSELQRTFHYASLLIQRLKLSFKPTIDSRLNEIDYGEWTGLTNEEVISRFGQTAFDAWDKHSHWPAQGNWGTSELATIAETQSFIHDLIRCYKADETVVVITSNGRLRYYLKFVDQEFEKRCESGTFKVKTGNICQMNYAGRQMTIPYWNIDPLHYLKL